MTSPTSRLLVGVAAVALCSLTGCSGDDTAERADNPAGVIISDSSSDLAEGSLRGAEPVAPFVMPNVTLTATNDKPFNLITDTGYPNTVVFFGYTHCADVCPLVMSDLTAAYLQLPDDVRDETQVVYITTDPARDTPGVLRSYLDQYHADFVGLTGDLDDITTAAKGMGVAIEGMERLPGGGYDVGHGAQVIGFHDNDADVIWPEGTSASDMSHDIAELAGR